MGRDRDLVLPPNTFAYVLDTTKGKVSVAVGPIKVSFSNTESPVQWDPSLMRFTEVNNNISQAIQVFPMAPEGHYIVLQNPVEDGNKHPAKGMASDAMDLDVGRKVNLAGPAAFPLWPGQSAAVIEGHHLRNNQYLIVRVYDENQANTNWQNAVLKRQVTPAQTQGSQQLGQAQTDGTAGSDAAVQQTTTDSVTADAAGERPNFTMGQLLLVKGTAVSFFMPPTGIEVVAEGTNQFVREAVTLERLEYCILISESGDKRYMQGPDVVFPQPTEKFVEVDGKRKFLAIELNEQSGLYVKVIAPYNEGGIDHKVGDELFITGGAAAIYFPRPEHSIIAYDGRQKHHAIAIPAGEGRYVLDRNQGTVDTVKGPKMFLPDPRKQVVVLRILDDRTVDLLYPGNREAIEINRSYRDMSTRLSPGQHLESATLMRAAGLSPRARHTEAEAFAGDTLSRGSQYTPPRSIVLDTKYEGAVALNIWPGFAVLVTKKTGERRVELGPKMVLLEYDETLMPLELSTGRPKDDKRLVRTAYLRILNNQVGDIVTVETKDLVKVSVEVSYRVNFEGNTAEEREKWFSIENYVKVLTDHARSRLRNAGKRHSIEQFYTNAIDITRDALLGVVPEGGKRPGLMFDDNNMRITDIEVLNVTIENMDVAELLVGAQTEALTGAIQVSTAEAVAERTKRIEALNRATLDERDKTAEKQAEVAKKVIERRLQQMIEDAKVLDARLAGERSEQVQRIDLAALDSKQKLEHLAGETMQMVERMKGVSPELANALTMFSDQNLVEKIITSMGPAAMVAGTTSADIFAQVFKDTPFEAVMKNLATRPLAVVDRTRRSAG